MGSGLFPLNFVLPDLQNRFGGIDPDFGAGVAAGVMGSKLIVRGGGRKTCHHRLLGRKGIGAVKILLELLRFSVNIGAKEDDCGDGNQNQKENLKAFLSFFFEIRSGRNKEVFETVGFLHRFFHGFIE